MTTPALKSIRLTLDVNGVSIEVEVPGEWRLIDVLRDALGLVGTKEGCSVGVCGLCSVLVDGELMSACLLPVVNVQGASVETVEGLAGCDGALSSLQEAFLRYGGFQCGICTPGQLMAATALLREQPHATPDEVRRWMMGNLCRCTGYEGILAAIAAVAASCEAG